MYVDVDDYDDYYDTDEDEVISREEFVALSSFERSSSQRAWRSVAGYYY